MSTLSIVNMPISSLIKDVRNSSQSRFYLDVWGDADTFEKLPPISRETFLQTPLSKRRYKDERSLVKIVNARTGSFLSEWSFDDIGRELWGPVANRPLVYLSDSHEAVEKSMWCYEQNVVPLIGERDPDIAMFAAEKYRIDSLITDAVALPKLLPYLEKREMPLETISIIGNTFDSASLLPFERFARNTSLVLALPEVGGFGRAPLSENPIFSAHPDCIIEQNNGSLVITKLRELITPIIKYRTEAMEIRFS